MPACPTWRNTSSGLPAEREQDRRRHCCNGTWWSTSPSPGNVITGGPLAQKHDRRRSCRPGIQRAAFPLHWNHWNIIAGVPNGREKHHWHAHCKKTPSPASPSQGNTITDVPLPGNTIAGGPLLIGDLASKWSLRHPRCWAIFQLLASFLSLRSSWSPCQPWFVHHH